MASNDDYFSEDSLIELELGGGVVQSDTQPRCIERFAQEIKGSPPYRLDCHV